MSLPDFHDWFLQDVAIGEGRVRLKLRSDDRENILEMSGISDIRIGIDSVQIIVDGFNYEIVDGKNVARINSAISRFGMNCISEGDVGIIFVSADFHIGANIVCLCKDINVMLE